MSDQLTQDELVEEIDGSGTDVHADLRLLAAENLFFLASGVLGYKDVSVETHGQFCLFFQDEAKRRRLGLMPRTHLKSTIATVADSIRLTLADPVESSILIVNEVERTAKDFLTEIKNHFQQNTLLRKLYPELIPTRFSGPGINWSGTEATLPIEGRIDRAPHWRVLGVGAALTGQHVHRIKADDLIGFESAHSPAAMAYAKAWNDNIISLLIDQHVDKIDWIGTRWAVNDLYADIMAKYRSNLAVFTREAVENEVIIFPALHNWEEYTDLIENKPNIWYAQYCNNPIAAGKQDLPAGSIRTFRFSMDGQRVIIDLPNGGTKEWAWWQLDRVITVDPNSGAPDAPDCAAVIVSAVSPDDEVFVLSAWSARCSPTELVNRVYDDARRWRVREVGIEKAGQQNTAHYFSEKALSEDYRISVVPLSHGNRHKQDRIRGNMHPVLASARLHLLPSQQTLRLQITEFPNNTGDLVDELDALAYGPEIWRKPLRTEDLERNQALHDKILRGRNARTGY